MFEINIEDRTYDLHRPNGCTVITIKYRDWPGNEFGLWLPETISVNEKPAWANFTNVHQDWKRDTQGTLSWKISFPNFDFHSSLTPDIQNSCLWYEHSFKNVSGQPLTKLNTGTCFHLVNAPQFISIEGERLWACLDGKWITTDKVPRDKSPDPRRISFLKEGIRTERTVVPLKRFSVAIMPETACCPLFIAENFNSTGSVGIACRNFYKLFNNNDPILRCIHSEGFPLEKLSPSERDTQKGVIVFYQGDHLSLINHWKIVISKQLLRFWS